MKPELGRARGKVYLVGAGPGAPDLITMRAARVLERANIVFYDALVHADTVALAVHAEKIAVGKRCGRYSTAQRFINKRLVDAAGNFETVVRLKGGDPMLFGRAQEEIDALRDAGVEFEVVPGVTAALAACADIGIALTQRGVSRSVSFATPRVGAGEMPSKWAASIGAADSSALYMAAGQARAIAAELVTHGMGEDTPVVIVENASLPDMRHTTTSLGALLLASNERTAHGPAVILLGRAFANTAAKSRDNADAADAQPDALSAA